MPKQSGNKITKAAEQTAGILVLAALIALLLYISAIPFYCLYLMVTSKIKVKNLLADSRGKHHFWLTDELKSRFKILNHNLAVARSNKNHAIRDAEISGISKNNDGQYSMRSNKGKEVRRIIDESNEFIENATREITEIQDKPHSDWKQADIAFRNTCASWCGLIGFALCLPFCIALIKQEPEITKGVIVFLWCLACLGGGLFYVIAKYLFPSPIRQHFTEPPQVDMTNVDQWDIENGQPSSSGTSQRLDSQPEEPEAKQESAELPATPPTAPSQKIHENDRTTTHIQSAQGSRKFISTLLICLSIFYLVITLIGGGNTFFIEKEQHQIGDIIGFVIVTCIMALPGIGLLYLGKRLAKKKVALPSVSG
jgi:hypothetical protein